MTQKHSYGSTLVASGLRYDTRRNCLQPRLYIVSSSSAERQISVVNIVSLLHSQVASERRSLRVTLEHDCLIERTKDENIHA
jgi:hypothetical protein